MKVFVVAAQVYQENPALNGMSQILIWPTFLPKIAASGVLGRLGQKRRQGGGDEGMPNQAKGNYDGSRLRLVSYPSPLMTPLSSLESDTELNTSEEERENERQWAEYERRLVEWE